MTMSNSYIRLIGAPPLINESAWTWARSNGAWRPPELPGQLLAKLRECEWHERGNDEDRRTAVREYRRPRDMGFMVVTDIRIPAGEVYLVDHGKVVGKITNVGQGGHERDDQ